MISLVELTQSEISDWELLLAPTLPERIKVLGNLLKYADEDHMSAEDRIIVQSSFHKLVQEYAARLRRDRNTT